ncbi:unnamed protein product [Cunninghamella blakesleeana]
MKTQMALSTNQVQEYEPLIKKEIEPKKRIASPLHVLIPIFLLFFSRSFVDTTFIQFYTDIICDLKKDDFPDITNCNVPEIQSLVSQLQAAIGFSSYICSILTSGFYGSLADRYGRKAVYQISSIGSMIYMVSYILLFKLNTNNIIGEYLVWTMLIAIPLIKSTLIADTVMINFFQLYIADTTTPETRTTGFSHMMGSMLSAGSIAPIIAGYIMKKTGSILYIFYSYLIISMILFLYLLFILPESLDITRMKKNQQDYDEKPKTSFIEKINIFSSITSLLLNDKRNTQSSKYKMTNYSILIVTLIKCILHMTYQLPLLLYGMLVFHWTTYESGICLSIHSFIRLLVVMILFPFMVKKYQSYTTLKQQQRINKKKGMNLNHSHIITSTTKKDENDEYFIIYKNILFNVWVIRIVFIIMVFCYILIASANSTFTYIFIQCILSVDILLQPTLRTLFTSLIDPSLIGTLSGAQSIVDGISRKYLISSFLIHLFINIFI